MARIHRLATILAALASLYALLFFAILPVPFVDEDVIFKVLPTVCRFSEFGLYGEPCQKVPDSLLILI
jgi:hypothetical protein